MLRAGRTTLENLSDAPELDAERLLLHVLGKREPSWLYAHGDTALTSEQADQFEALVAERKSGKPLAYILREAEFYGRTFYVNKDVLIPRPETEELVETALSYIKRRFGETPDVTRLQTSSVREKRRPLTIADIGTGSGCIAITLALELNRHYILIATDISPAALEVARKNADRHGVADRIEFLEGDMLEPLVGIHIDLIVSNPPYIPVRELDFTQCPPPGWTLGRDRAGLAFEPRLALDGGPDGQQFVRTFQDIPTPAVFETVGGVIKHNPAFAKASAGCSFA